MLILSAAAAALLCLRSNAVDKADPRWAGGKWFPYQKTCPHPLPGSNSPGAKGWNSQIPSGCIPNGTDGWGCNCANSTGECNVGQSCLWFSQGTTIGCKVATGGPSNPNLKPCFPGCGDCDSTNPVNATLNSPELRTYNRKAKVNTKFIILNTKCVIFNANSSFLYKFHHF